MSPTFVLDFCHRLMSSTCELHAVLRRFWRRVPVTFRTGRSKRARVSARQNSKNIPRTLRTNSPQSEESAIHPRIAPPVQSTTVTAHRSSTNFFCLFIWFENAGTSAGLSRTGQRADRYFWFLVCRRCWPQRQF